MKLKERIKSLSGNLKEEKIKRELEEIETINIELDHRVTKLVTENEHLKQTYKQLYDSIKSSREKVLVITALKDTLSKIKGKAIVNEALTLHPIDPELLKTNVSPLAPRLRNNRTAHYDYLKHTQEETATLREIVKNERLLNPLNTSLDYACTKLVAVTLVNNNKKIRFTEHIPSSGNTPIKTTSFTNVVSNKPVLSSTGVNLLISASGSQPQGNTKKDRIQQTQIRAKKNKLEDHPKNVRPSLLNKKSVVNTKAISSVPNSKLNVNFDLKCATCTVKFGNDHVAKIMGYGDYKIGNVNILGVYFVEGLGHNLFSVGHFCDSDLEVAFHQHTCFIRNLDGVDLLTGSRGNNLYTLSLGGMMSSSPICILSKASKTKYWLWHRRLSHLNFGEINHLAKQGLVRSLPKLKFEKDHLCSACAMGKSKKKSHKPKSEDTNQEKLYLLHMDLCRPMRVESVNGKKYILIIVDDYSRFTWVKCLRSKDEAPDFIIKDLKMIQVRLKVGISHETSVARSPQQNGVVERRNRTLIEAVCTMLIYAQASLFLWAEADIGIFIGYAPTKKAFRIYNRHTRRIVETIHVDFDELTAMASEQRSSGPALNEMTPTTINSGLVAKPYSSTPYVPPSRNDWDLMFQPLFDKLFTHPPSVDPPAPEVIAPIADVISPVQDESTGSPSLTTIDQDAPSPIAHMGNDPLFGVPIPEVASAQSSSTVSPHTIVQPNHQIPQQNSK
nr:retrovirus-related Pol polyprotein from transposon TNT 1-94 [Tanacetum cinerariifolium]